MMWCMLFVAVHVSCILCPPEHSSPCCLFSSCCLFPPLPPLPHPSSTSLPTSLRQKPLIPHWITSYLIVITFIWQVGKSQAIVMTYGWKEGLICHYHSTRVSTLTSCCTWVVPVTIWYCLPTAKVMSPHVQQCIGCSMTGGSVQEIYHCRWQLYSELTCATFIINTTLSDKSLDSWNIPSFPNPLLPPLLRTPPSPPSSSSLPSFVPPSSHSMLVFWRSLKLSTQTTEQKRNLNLQWVAVCGCVNVVFVMQHVCVCVCEYVCVCVCMWHLCIRASGIVCGCMWLCVCVCVCCVCTCGISVNRQVVWCVCITRHVCVFVCICVCLLHVCIQACGVYVCMQCVCVQQVCVCLRVLCMGVCMLELGQYTNNIDISQYWQSQYNINTSHYSIDILKYCDVSQYINLF